MTESKEDWLDKLITEFRKQAQGLYGIDREVFKQAIQTEISKAEKRGELKGRIDELKDIQWSSRISDDTKDNLYGEYGRDRFNELQSELKAMEGKEAKM